MAKKMKADEARKTGGISAVDLKRVVTGINRHKEAASENSGLAGQATKDAIERYGLDRKALTTVAGLAKKDIAQAQGTLRGMIDYADKLGMFDGVDMFDDLIPTLERIIARAREKEKAPAASKSASVVTDMLGATH